MKITVYKELIKVLVSCNHLFLTQKHTNTHTQTHARIFMYRTHSKQLENTFCLMLNINTLCKTALHTANTNYKK